MMIEKVIGLLLFIGGFFWLWLCFRKVDKSVDKYYSIPRDLFTGIFIIILGLAIFFGALKLPL